MRILVPIKRTPDPNSLVRLTADAQIDLDGCKWIVNPFDEIALEEAVRQREAGLDAEIVVVSIGPEEAADQLRACLAMGADRAIHVCCNRSLEPIQTAHLLAAVVATEQPDLILMGKQAIDGDQNQTGQMLAGRLGWPQATFASTITISDNHTTAVVEREVDTGRETLQVRLPAVVTADLRLAEPRYVALPAIIRARNKPMANVAVDDLGGVPDCGVRTVGYELPPSRAPGVMLPDAASLAAKIREAVQ